MAEYPAASNIGDSTVQFISVKAESVKTNKMQHEGATHDLNRHESQRYYAMI